MGIATLVIVCAVLGGGWLLTSVWLRHFSQRDPFSGRVEEDEAWLTKEERTTKPRLPSSGLD